MFSPRLYKEIKRIDDGHIDDQIDRHIQCDCWLGECQTGDEVSINVLLPVNEVLSGQYLQGVTQNRGAAMGGRTQSDLMR